MNDKPVYDLLRNYSLKKINSSDKTLLGGK